jgi:putative transposase
MKKSRFFYLHEGCNKGKIEALESLHAEYLVYLKICIQVMLKNRVLTVPLSKKQTSFPKAGVLSSDIQGVVRGHAVAMVSSWAKRLYKNKLKKHIWVCFTRGDFDEGFRKQLYTIGKCLVSEPSKSISQEAIDLYWSWLEDEKIVGKSPSPGPRTPMTLGVNTGILGSSKRAHFTEFWINLSTLRRGKRTSFPLKGNPYIKSSGEVVKGIQVRKDQRSCWRFEAVEVKEYLILESEPSLQRVGVDVGLNVLAATSLGGTYGKEVKPQFDKKYQSLLDVRRNRQRQGLFENSPRLDKLEYKLTEFLKTEVGKITNKLVRRFPTSVFVLEDLDLRGCKGQKRFCYRALAKSLQSKAPTEVVNPAYSSQTCPSCGHVSRRNRNGIHFVCRSCGRRSHADVVGGINLLRRSEMKQIDSNTSTAQVKLELVKLYWSRRNPGQDCPQAFLDRYAPQLYGQRLTTRASPQRGSKGLRKRQSGIASN